MKSCENYEPTFESIQGDTCSFFWETCLLLKFHTTKAIAIDLSNNIERGFVGSKLG